MIVSWDWLKQYVTLEMTPAELAERLMMAGLNHEETYAVGDDVAINLEVTSNRPDCLGHLGIAREAAVLFGRPLEIPAAQPKAGKAEVGELAKLRVDNPRECPRYTARVLRGVKVGPSPAWLVRRLTTLGVATINNVVDVTNYVMLECGQPLHAFDLAKLKGRQIIVRQATKGETFLAINHKAYTLEPTTCVIADGERAVGLAGVMGGADTEVSAATSELLIESAAFDPMSIRNTARALNLHSDSSYRFERGLDPEGVDWASRRACELILELAGGELACGVLDAGEKPRPRAPITLRFAQLKRVLGIDVPPVEAREILSALGNQEQQADESRVVVAPPSWRRDLTREIDLIEEVARVYGYDKIPEDVSVPMATSHRTEADRVLSKTRQVLTAAGFDEAMTTSAVEAAWSEAFSPWTDAPALRANTPVLGTASYLRRSLVPSLLNAQRTNETLSNFDVRLFETAHVYLPDPTGGLPREELMVAMLWSGGQKLTRSEERQGANYRSVKGVVESLVATLNPAAALIVRATSQKLFDSDCNAELSVFAESVGELPLGYIGEVSLYGLNLFNLIDNSTVAELRVSTLLAIANLVPQFVAPPVYPAVTRDLNLVVDEAVRWSDVEQTVRAAAEPHGESIAFQDVYRDANRLGPGKKSLLFTLTLRWRQGTLTGEEADGIRARVVAACEKAHGAQLRA